MDFFVFKGRKFLNNRKFDIFDGILTKKVILELPIPGISAKGNCHIGKLVVQRSHIWDSGPKKKKISTGIYRLLVDTNNIPLIILSYRNYADMYDSIQLRTIS